MSRNQDPHIEELLATHEEVFSNDKRNIQLLGAQAYKPGNFMHEAGGCPAADVYHAQVLDPTHANQKNASLIVMNNRVIGQLKHFENRSFLSYQNIRNSTEQVLVQGGIYQLHQGLVSQTLNAHHTQNWNYLRIERMIAKPIKLYNQANEEWFLKTIHEIQELF